MRASRSGFGPIAAYFITYTKHLPTTIAWVVAIHFHLNCSSPSQSVLVTERVLGSISPISSAAWNFVDGDWTSKPLQGTRSEFPKLESVAQSVADGTRDQDSIGLSRLT